jgi:large subunit ribosomal protein L4
MTSDTKNAKVFDASGKEKGTVALTSAVFQATIKRDLVHGAVRWQRAKKRAGTHDVLTRSEIKGGKKKPFKQKGTGNARAGSSVSPLWVGGAVVHGPTPRSYEFRLSKKMRKGALQSALSAKAGNGEFLVLEGIAGASGKTRDAVSLLKSLGLQGTKVLVVLPNEQSIDRENFMRSMRNIKGVTVVPVAGVNVYDLVNCRNVVCAQEALSQLESRVA